MMSYDPAFTNTASTRSTITYIDGGEGILRYRGYPIEQLAERSSHLEVAYLLLKGELPTSPARRLRARRHLPHLRAREHQRTSSRASATTPTPWGWSSAVAALSTFYPEAKDIDDPDVRWIQIVRIVAKMPTLAAYAYRHHRGLPYVYPENELSYTENFLNMLFRIGSRDYKPSPVLERRRSTCSSSSTPITSRTARPRRCG
jgi:citrate synthase